MQAAEPAPTVTAPATSPATVARGVLFLLPALVAFQAISTDLYLPALPSIVLDLRTTVERVQLTLSLFLVAFGLAQLVYGPLSDRFGRRPLLLAGSGLYVAASIACTLAPNVELLILARVLQGAGACAGVVLGRAVVRDLYQPVDAARMLAYLGTAMSAAPILGPVLGGLLTEWFGWRASFAALTLFGAGSFIATWAILPETNLRRDPHAAHPAHIIANSASLLRDRRYILRVAALALGYSAIFTFISGTPYVLIEVIGLSPRAYGWCFAGGVVGYAGGAYLAARLGRRLGLERLVSAGTALSAASAVSGLLLALLLPPSWPMVVGVMFATMVGLGLSLPTMMGLAIGPYPEKAGLASALMGCLQLATAALTGVILAAAYNATAIPLMLALVTVTVSGLVFARLARRHG